MHIIKKISQVLPFSQQLIIIGFVGICGALFGSVHVISAATHQPNVTYSAGASDQDDMAIWVHPTDPTQSLIIGSDKAANIVVVYDLQGNELQTATDVGRPGNIDVRYNFPLGGQNVDIIAFNDRLDNIIRVFKIGADQRSIERIDDGSISSTFVNYGFGLYANPDTGKFYAFATEDAGGSAEQYELVDNGSGRVTGSVVRSLTVNSQSEGVVADDANKIVFIGEEAGGVIMFDAEPTGSGTGQDVLPIGSATTLGADVEGITLYHFDDGGGYLIVSSQGSNEFVVFDKDAVINGGGQTPLATFSISGASSTDGIDVNPVNLGGDFSEGIFTAHSGGAAFYGTSWGTIAAAEGLTVDTGWDPRSNTATLPSPAPPSSFPSPSASASPQSSPSPGASAPPPAVLVLQPGDEGLISCAGDALEQVGFNATQTQLDLFCRQDTGSTNIVTLSLTQSASFECPTGSIQHTRSPDGKTVDVVCTAGSSNTADLQIGESVIVNCSGTSLAVNLNAANTQADAVCNSPTGSDTFVFGFKLQGLTTPGVIVPVEVTFVSTVTDQVVNMTTTFTSDASGVLRPDGGSIALPVGLTDGNTWQVFVKTDVSLRKLLGTQVFTAGQTTAPATWDVQTAKAGDFVSSIKPNVINLQDVASILAVYTQLTVPVSPAIQKFDINYDQQIDLLDIATVLSNYTALEVPGD